MSNPLQSDLDQILAHTSGLWDEFRGNRLFITGGTGFFGCWLLESFLWANDKLDLRAEAVVLTRSPSAFMKKAPHLAGHPAIRCHKGDVRDFQFPEGRFSHVIHAATETSSKINVENPLLIFEIIVEGTRRVLDFTVKSGAKKFLLTSSGAVYGKQPSGLSHISENFMGAPDPVNPGSAYAEGKRAAELLCCLYAQRYGFMSKVARCFAFVGPYLPLDQHFAIGNFIRDALLGRPITVKGNGSPYRSYLYAADLAIWLWTILVRGRSCQPYNVGAADSCTIAELAKQVAELGGNVPVVIAQPACASVLPERYVPDVSLAFGELGLNAWIPLEQAIEKTISWQRKAMASYTKGA